MSNSNGAIQWQRAGPTYQEQQRMKKKQSEQQSHEEEEVEDEATIFGAVDDLATERQMKGAAVAGALVGVAMAPAAVVAMTTAGAVLLGAAGAAYIAKTREGPIGEVARSGGDKIADVAEHVRERTEKMRCDSVRFDQAASTVERVVQKVGNSTSRAAETMSKSAEWMRRKTGSFTSQREEAKEKDNY